MIINKIQKRVIVLISLLMIYLILTFIYSRFTLYKKEINDSMKLASNNSLEQINNSLFATSNQIIEDVVYQNTTGKIVYDGLTMQELTDKLNRSLNSTLAGKGEIFATHSLELGLDPYLMVAITLQETGCRWDCSYLVKACNNVGGQKGSPRCNGGAYKAYNTLDEGIIGYIDNIYYNYYLQGLKTAEEMNSKYAESKSWSYNVNSYVEKIKAA